MTETQDPHHVDVYAGTIHDRIGRITNDALVALRRLSHETAISVSTDPEERGAVPTISHDVDRAYFAQISVDVYENPNHLTGDPRTACVIVMPGCDDVLRTSVKIVVEAPGTLFAEDADHRTIATAVIEAAAVHTGRAIARHRASDPDAPSVDPATTDTEFEMEFEGATRTEAMRWASIAALADHEHGLTRLVMATPWNPACACTPKGHAIEMDPTATARMPTMLRFRTSYMFTDAKGLGNSPIVTIQAVCLRPEPIDAMERLRIMKEVQAA